MIVVDFGTNIDQDKKKKQFEAFKERMKREEEKRDQKNRGKQAKIEV